MALASRHQTSCLLGSDGKVTRRLTPGHTLLISSVGVWRLPWLLCGMSWCGREASEGQQLLLLGKKIMMGEPPRARYYDMAFCKTAFRFFIMSFVLSWKEAQEKREKQKTKDPKKVYTVRKHFIERGKGTSVWGAHTTFALGRTTCMAKEGRSQKTFSLLGEHCSKPWREGEAQALFWAGMSYHWRGRQYSVACFWCSLCG